MSIASFINCSNLAEKIFLCTAGSRVVGCWSRFGLVFWVWACWCCLGLSLGLVMARRPALGRRFCVWFALWFCCCFVFFCVACLCVVGFLFVDLVLLEVHELLLIESDGWPCGGGNSHHEPRERRSNPVPGRAQAFEKPRLA